MAGTSSFKYGYPHSVDDALKSFQEIQELGFRFIEMEGFGRHNLEEVYKRRKEIRRVLDDCGLHVHNFCVVDPEMTSLDVKTRYEALERFRFGCGIAAVFDTETLHLASYSPPVEYLQTPPYQLSGGTYKFENMTRLRIPNGFDWAQVWEALVISTRSCADLAAEYQRTVFMEPRIGEVVCSVDSLLRLIEHVDRPNLSEPGHGSFFGPTRERGAICRQTARSLCECPRFGQRSCKFKTCCHRGRLDRLERVPAGSSSGGLHRLSGSRPWCQRKLDR